MNTHWPEKVILTINPLRIMILRTQQPQLLSLGVKIILIKQGKELGMFLFSTAKSRFIQFVQLLLPASFFSRCIYKHIIRSIPEVMYDKSIAVHIDSIKLLRKASIQQYSNLSSYPIYFRKEKAFDPLYLYKLRNVVVHTLTGICSSEKHCFQESYGSLRQILRKNTQFSKNAQPCIAYDKITCIKTTGFYHLLLEELPRLLLLIENEPKTKIIASASTYKFIINILKYMTKLNIISQPSYLNSESISVNSYVFVQATAYSGFIHKEDLYILRSTFLPHILRKETEANLQDCKMIYISRRYSRRSLVNEKELESLMKSHQIKIIYLEKLSFADQIFLFSNLTLVIGLHGAGLSNIVWCSSGTTILEIFTPERFVDCYARIANTLSLNYNYYNIQSQKLISSTEQLELEKLILNFL